MTTEKDIPKNSQSKDRRDFILKMTNELKENDELRKQIYKDLEDKNIIKYIFEYLKNRDYPDKFYTGTNTIPKSNHHKDINKACQNSVESFLIHVCEEIIEYENNFKNIPETMKCYNSLQFYNKYKDYYVNQFSNRDAIEKSNKSFALKIKKFVTYICVKRKNTGISYEIVNAKGLHQFLTKVEYDL